MGRDGGRGAGGWVGGGLETSVMFCVQALVVYVCLCVCYEPLNLCVSSLCKGHANLACVFTASIFAEVSATGDFSR